MITGVTPMLIDPPDHSEKGCNLVNNHKMDSKFFEGFIQSKKSMWSGVYRSEITYGNQLLGFVHYFSARIEQSSKKSKAEQKNAHFRWFFKGC